jgi:hypothetical protein
VPLDNQQPPASAAALQAPSASNSFGGNPNASAFDAVIVLSAAAEAAAGSETVNNEPGPPVTGGSTSNLWSTFTAVPPRSFDLQMGPTQPGELVAEAVDVLLEMTERAKARAAQKAEKAERENESRALNEDMEEEETTEAVVAEGEMGRRQEEEEGEQGAGDWRSELGSKIAERAGRLSLAARMWREHANGGRQLCVDEMEEQLKEPWDEAKRAYEKQVRTTRACRVCAS